MITRWLSFFVLVAAVVALASFGDFGSPAAADAGSVQGGAASVLLLSLLAVTGAGFVGFLAQRTQRQKDRARSSAPALRVAGRPPASGRTARLRHDPRSSRIALGGRPPRTSEGPSGLR